MRAPDKSSPVVQITQAFASLELAKVTPTESARLANARYESGLIDFQTLLTAQQTMLSAQDSHTAAIAARTNASIQLFKALGGGWQPNALASAQTGSK